MTKGKHTVKVIRCGRAHRPSVGQGRCTYYDKYHIIRVYLVPGTNNPPTSFIEIYTILRNLSVHMDSGHQYNSINFNTS